MDRQEIMEVIRARHSVRSYTEKAIPEDIAQALRQELDQCNAEGGLHLQLVTGDEHAFEGAMAHYGHFSGVRNYVALVGPAGAAGEEKLGYWGERIALTAQRLGLNSCWVALTFSRGAAKRRCTVRDGEKLVGVLTLGYGVTQGTAHRSRPMEALCEVRGAMPDWFRTGMEAVQLAPTAMNQQRFRIALDEKGQVTARSLSGFYTRVDLGIVRYHFEAATGVKVG